MTKDGIVEEVEAAVLWEDKAGGEAKEVFVGDGRTLISIILGFCWCWGSKAIMLFP